MQLFLSDLFRIQLGTRFKEGIVNAEKKVDFEDRLGPLRDIWEYILERKGWELCNWFLKYKEHKMKKMHDRIGESSFVHGLSSKTICN